MTKAQEFKQQSEQTAFDTALHHKLQNSIGQYQHKHLRGREQFADLELAKTRASGLKQKVIENLDKYLIEFESNYIKNGGKLIWALNAEEALKEIEIILQKHNINCAVKSKSMISEEIHLNEFLKAKNIDCPETDLGEFIQQEAGERPFHIVTPAMHKSKEEIAELYKQKFGTPAQASPEEITKFTREYLRKKFYLADIGITGANFLIADAGAIAITENEGNATLSVSMPRIHIAIAGIEKIIPSLNDLDLFWPLLATYGTGQKLTAYNSVIFGPRQSHEVDGPTDMYLILLDNGRTNILEQPEQRRALNCIRCGACLNVCPVYTTIGGHAYGTTYSGPIGKVITPLMKGLKEYQHLSSASSLCGKCTEVCPVKIDLHNLLLHNRKEAIQQGLQPKAEKVTWYFWKSAMLSRKKMNKGSAKVKNFMLQTFFKKTWGEHRDLPVVAEKSFNQLMRERTGNR